MATTELSIRNRPVDIETKTSRLLSLPKELRLEIWKYTVTDPSMDTLVLRIRQGLVPCSHDERPASKRKCNSLLQETRFHSVVKTTFEKPRNSPISVAVLRSNKFVYHEALPFLYHSVTFDPSSMLHEFLAPLSDFAKQHIRAVRLSIDYYFPTPNHFGWAVLCAQVASLPCLQRVEIKSEHVHRPQNVRIRERLLRPLLKIKARKMLVPESNDDAFQTVLSKVKEETDTEKAARRERVEAQSAETIERKHGNGDGEPATIKVQNAKHPCLIPESLEQPIVNNLLAEWESEQAAKDADEWDMVSVRSFSPGGENDQLKPIIGRKRSRSNSEDGHPPLLGCSDWELVEPDQFSDDGSK